jgi:hypothetical protein
MDAHGGDGQPEFVEIIDGLAVIQDYDVQLALAWFRGPTANPQ